MPHQFHFGVRFVPRTLQSELTAHAPSRLFIPGVRRWRVAPLVEGSCAGGCTGARRAGWAGLGHGGTGPVKLVQCFSGRGHGGTWGSLMSGPAYQDISSAHEKIVHQLNKHPILWLLLCPPHFHHFSQLLPLFTTLCTLQHLVAMAKKLFKICSIEGTVPLFNLVILLY